MTLKELKKIVCVSLLLCRVVKGQNFELNQYFQESVVGSLRSLKQDSPTDLQLCLNDTVNFIDQCGLQLYGMQQMTDKSMAACCWENDCCNQAQKILDQQCFQNGCGEFDAEVLELIGAYNALCGQKFQLPQCASDSLASIPQKCQELNNQLMNECGQRDTISNSPMDTFLRLRDEQEAHCCWPSTCCDLSKQYFEQGCDLSCYSSETQIKGGYGQYIFGNGIVNTWQQICSFPANIKNNCQVLQSTNGQGVLDANEAVTIKSSRDTTELNTPPVEQEIQVQSVEQAVVAQLPTCDKSQSDFLLEDYGPNGPWTTTTKTFCNFTMDEVKTSGSKEIQLCCDITNMMFQGACAYQNCYTTPITLFDTKTFDVLSLWQVLCRPKVQNCNLSEALALASGGTSSQFQINQKNPQQTQNSSPISLSLESIINPQGQGQVSPSLSGQGQGQGQVSTSLSGQGQGQVSPSLSGQGQGQGQVSPSPTPNEASTAEISIYSALKQIPVLSTFNHAIEFLKLESTLQMDGRGVTMFAPTNTALSTIITYFNTTAERLANATGGESWSATYLLHVSMFSLKAEDLEIGKSQELTTLESSSVRVDVKDSGEVFVYGCCSERNSAKVISNALFKDGQLWVVDNVLLPPRVAEPFFQSFDASQNP